MTIERIREILSVSPEQLDDLEVQRILELTTKLAQFYLINKKPKKRRYNTKPAPSKRIDYD